MNKKAFTLVEMLTAIAIIAMLIGFASVIFNTCSDAYRSGDANMEIMQNLRAITTQLNKDFEGFREDGYLYIRTQNKFRKEYLQSSGLKTVRMDRIYYFSTGDFQSWFEPDIKGNIARIYIGHGQQSLQDDITLLSECRLARDVRLLTPTVAGIDHNDVSFAQCKAGNFEDPVGVLDDSVSTDLFYSSDNARRIFCENIGEFKIEWTYGDISGSSLIWYPSSGTTSELLESGPDSSNKPEAIKFIFTLYDSKGVLKGGRRFSHIVYLKD